MLCFYEYEKGTYEKGLMQAKEHDDLRKKINEERELQIQNSKQRSKQIENKENCEIAKLFK